MKERWNNFWKGFDAAALARASHSKKRIIKVLQRHLRPGMKVLDAGCGSGFFTNFFACAEADATAVDYSEEALRLAEKLVGNKAAYQVADLLSDTLPDTLGTRFDLIFSDGLFEHFTDAEQQRLMGNLRRVKSDDGLIATFVPNRFSPWQLIRPFMMPGIKEKPFSLERLVRLSEGMSIIEQGGLNVIPCALSPEKWLGSIFGMLLYTIAR